ncbi:hypothetical protein PAA26_06415 [Methanomassiliicoccaceae archaeon COG_1]|nr:hypothetical protein [Methanomassiliicoccaceae archaeon COG_1]
MSDAGARAAFDGYVRGECGPGIPLGGAGGDGGHRVGGGKT